ncbi:MAG TPA: hypothetical protein VNJ01_12685 [Bacteriovoracaceae bacterium]|nr:hypothetical protein [Bacteriovoracaceae bacterium]
MKSLLLLALILTSLSTFAQSESQADKNLNEYLEMKAKFLEQDLKVYFRSMNNLLSMVPLQKTLAQKHTPCSEAEVILAKAKGASRFFSVNKLYKMVEENEEKFRETCSAILVDVHLELLDKKSNDCTVGVSDSSGVSKDTVSGVLVSDRQGRSPGVLVSDKANAE